MNQMLTKQEWENFPLQFQGKAFINGRYVDSVSASTFDCISPVDGRNLCQIANCDIEDVNLAVKNARQTFETGIWANETPASRKKILMRFAGLIEKHANELALLETLDMGKPISESLHCDIAGSARSICWHAEAIDKLYGEITPSPHSELGLITREPVGVVAAIVPWNFPLLMASWKIGPALAAGNSVLLKPSEKSPLTALRVAQLAVEAGLPPGVLNVIPGFGETAGKALGLHPGIDTVAFTGSTRVAKQLMTYAGQSNMKRVWLEAGGKSPNIVFADAPNLKWAAKMAAEGICYNQGEVCTAMSRLLVEASIKEEFLDLVLEEMQAWQPSHPLDPDTKMGAIVDGIQIEKVLSYITKGREEGADLRLGGKRIMQDTGGLYMEPTVFDKVQNSMTIAQEEIFGPVLSVMTFSQPEEAVAIANDTTYGLAAALWTQNITRAHNVARQLRAGTVSINQGEGGDITTPFGGYKQSGIGRDRSLYAHDKYTEIKATLISLAT